MAAYPIVVFAVDFNGDVQPGAKLFVYEAGTTTPVAIYDTADLDTQYPNPAICDSAGRLVAWVDDADGPFKVILRNAGEGQTYFSQDNVDFSQAVAPYIFIYPANPDPETVEQVRGEGDVQVARIIAEGNLQEPRVTDEGDTQNARLITTGNAQDARLIDTGDAQDLRVEQQGDTQDARLIAQGAAQAADVALAAAAQFYADTAAGIAGTSSGDYFIVVETAFDGFDYFNLYLNNAGTPDFVDAISGKQRVDQLVVDIRGLTGDAPIMEFAGNRWAYIVVDQDGFFMRGQDMDGLYYVQSPGEPLTTLTKVAERTETVEGAPTMEFAGGRFSTLRVDADNFPISGRTLEGVEYALNSDGEFSPVGSGASGSAGGAPSVLMSNYDATHFYGATEDLEDTWFVIAFEGQSFADMINGLVAGNDGIISTTQPYPDVVLSPTEGFRLSDSGAVSGLTTHIESASGSRGETAFSGFANNLVEMIYDAFGKYPGAVIGYSSALGGTEQHKLLGGSTQFERSTRAFLDICALARAQGKKVVKLCNFIQQGNRDTNRLGRQEWFLQGRRVWRSQREAADFAACGQQRPAVWADAQTSPGSTANPQSDTFNPSMVSMAQSHLHGDAANVICAMAHYSFYHGDGTSDWDGIHPGSQGHYDIGFTLSLAVFNHWFGAGFQPMQAVWHRAQWTGRNKIAIPIAVPFVDPSDNFPSDIPLIDTSDSIVSVTGLTGSYRGFQAAHRNSGDTAFVSLGITGLSIEGWGTEPWVEVTFSESARTSLRLWCGFRAESGSSPAGPLGGAVTPIRGTAAFTPQNGGTPLHHWMLAGGYAYSAHTV